MEKTHILSIHGFAATGVTSSVKVIAEEYLIDHKLLCIGELARDMAHEHGMEIPEWNIYARENGIPYDEILDDKQRELNKSTERWIVDSRLGYLFIPSSFKVYLKIDPHVGAERRLAQLQHKDPEKYKDLTAQEVFEDIARRDSNDLTTYMNLYNTNCSDESHYDLVIDTSYRTLHQVVSDIMMAYFKWLKKNNLEH